MMYPGRLATCRHVQHLDCIDRQVGWPPEQQRLGPCCQDPFDGVLGIGSRVDEGEFLDVL